MFLENWHQTLRSLSRTCWYRPSCAQAGCSTLQVALRVGRLRGSEVDGPWWEVICCSVLYKISPIVLSVETQKLCCAEIIFMSVKRLRRKIISGHTSLSFFFLKQHQILHHLRHRRHSSSFSLMNYLSPLHYLQ
jgi:hypothetical protein